MIDNYNKAKIEEEKNRAIKYGILIIKFDEIKNKIHYWGYHEGKRRIVDGRVYNLKGVTVDYSFYGLKILTRAFFLLDESHVRKQDKKDAIKEIENWLGWIPSRIPTNIKRYEGLYIMEIREMGIEDILKFGFEDLEVY